MNVQLTIERTGNFYTLKLLRGGTPTTPQAISRERAVGIICEWEGEVPDEFSLEDGNEINWTWQRQEMTEEVA